ncbi:MAG: trigger factor, partial [Bacillota bacterium]|nr:trigger factor [Bacillota bacterium]
MQATVAKLDKNRVQLQVEVASEEVDQALVEASRRLAQRVSIPGFRRGKVPRAVLERHLGKKPVYEEAVEILFPRAYHQAVLEKELEPIDQPELELIQLEEGKPFIFRVTVAVKPEVKLGQYKGLKAVKHVRPVTDQDVERVLVQLQERQAELASVEREEVQKGDFVLLDFDGFLDGKPFKGGAGRAVLLEVGSGRFIPGFEEQLIGAVRGKEREVT